MSFSNRTKSNPLILWSFVARDNIVLAEANIDEVRLHDMVNNAKTKLLAKQPTPGWEFMTFKSPGRESKIKLKGQKFHIYEHSADGDFFIWSVGCIYDAAIAVEMQQVESFIEKIVGISETFRENDDNWKYGGSFSAQKQFSPILLQRMEEVAYLGRSAMVNNEINNLKEIMSRNIEMIIERGEKIDSMQARSKELNEMAAVFKKSSKSLKRKMLWANAKHGMVLGTALAAGVAVVTVPIIVAL